MSGKPIRIPGPDHPITITPFAGRVTVRAGGKVVAGTTRALMLSEASYPPVLYIPREDAEMALLTRSAHRTYCPFKGDAGYFDLLPAGTAGANGVWSYEQPYYAVAAIRDHLAFYPDKVEIETQG